MAVKTAFQLSDSDVAQAIKERGERIYKQYGTPSLLVNSETLTTVSYMPFLGGFNRKVR